MTVLVTAATKHGATLEIAQAIGRTLREHGVEADVLPVEQVGAVVEYDAEILGSAAYYGKWLDEAVRFVDEHEAALAARPVWLFTSGPLGWPPKPAPEEAVHVDDILARTKAFEHRLIAGELDKHKLGVMERSVARALHAPEGDFRDWDAIEAWAKEIAASLAVSDAPARS